MLRFKKLSQHAITPFRGSPSAAGLDLASPYDIIVPAKDTTIVYSDLSFEFPNGTYGRIAERSSLALKHKISVRGGVIDSDYQGNVAVILYNTSNQDFQIRAGDRIAQIICEKIIYPKLQEVGQDGEFATRTFRRSYGFGSTSVAPRPPLIIYIEGNISSGKSTLVNTMKEKLGQGSVLAIPEPVERWQNEEYLKTETKNPYKTNLLKEMYDGKLSPGGFQAYVSLTVADRQVEGLKKAKTMPTIKYVIMDRSVSSSLVFAKVKEEMGHLMNGDKLCADVTNACAQKWVGHNADFIFYIQSTPEDCYQRMIARGIQEEKTGISLQYSNIQNCSQKFPSF